MINDLLKNDYSSSTIKHTKQYTSEMLECAVDDNLLIQNPARKIKLPKMPKTKTERGAFSINDEEKIIKFIPLHLTQEKPHVQHIIGKAILTLLKSGIRTEELLALPWKNINLEKRTIKIDCAVSLKKYIAYIKEPKTKTSYRTIPMHQMIYDILLETEMPKDKSKTVFCNSSGGIWGPPVFYRQYVKFFEALNKNLADGEKVEYRSPHACRHTFASDLNRLGVDPKSISELLGHANTDITFDVYTHTNDATKVIAIDKL